MTNQTDIKAFIRNITNNIKSNEWAWAEKNLANYLERRDGIPGMEFNEDEKAMAWDMLFEKKSTVQL